MMAAQMFEHRVRNDEVEASLVEELRRIARISPHVVRRRC